MPLCQTARLVIPALCLAMLACQTQTIPTVNQHTDSLQQIIDRGEMRVGYLVWAPCVVRDDSTGELSGIYPELIQELARDLDVNVAWNEINLQNFEDALQNGDIDFCAGPTFMTIPRAAAVAFTQPVTYVGNSGVVRTNDDFRPATIADLIASGRKVAVQKGQAMEEYFRQNHPEVDLLVIDSGGDLNGPLTAVAEGKADIGLANMVTVTNFAAEHPELTAVFTGSDQVEILPVAWSAPHDDDRLLRFLDSAITCFKSTGRLEQAQRRQSIQLLYDTPTLHQAVSSTD